jgi:hypothetical protein
VNTDSDILRRRYWALIGFSLAYGAVMVVLGGTLYASSPWHRLQADALLHGHLYLGDTLDQIRPGLAWHNGKVQQVWGLGVGLWLLPFQAAWRLFGGVVFPDRIALGLAWATLAFYTCITGLRMARNGQRAAGLGFVWLILLCPPMWTLSRASQLVFEETELYGLVVCLAILVAVIRLACFDSSTDVIIAGLLSGMAGLVRPTLAIYGLAAVLVCFFLAWRRHQSFRLSIFAGLCFAAGLGLVALTNQIRFGSPFEFGHRLTVTSDSMVYLTRFGNPYANTSLADASKELGGLLFFNSNVRDANAFAEELFPGQAPTTRWRRLYLGLFDPTWLLLCGAAFIIGILTVSKAGRGSVANHGKQELAFALWAWSVISFAVLGLFYLRFPIIASRYLLDFLPAFAGLLILFWMHASKRWPRISMILLTAWLGTELAIAKIPDNLLAAPSNPQPELRHVGGAPLTEFNGTYNTSQHPELSKITYNGYGWDPVGGFADSVVILAVDSPKFVELQVSDRREINGEPARKDVYRATIDGRPLHLRENRSDGDRRTVVFDVPAALQTGDQLIFLCFSGGYDAEDRASERFLYSMRWK